MKFTTTKTYTGLDAIKEAREFHAHCEALGALVDLIHVEGTWIVGKMEVDIGTKDVSKLGHGTVHVGTQCIRPTEASSLDITMEFEGEAVEDA